MKGNFNARALSGVLCETKDSKPQVAIEFEFSETGEKIYNRVHDNPSPHDVHTGDALNVVLDDLTNPTVYSQILSAATQQIDPQLVKNIEFSYAANMIAISLSDLSANGAPDYLLTTPAYATDRRLRCIIGKDRGLLFVG